MSRTRYPEWVGLVYMPGPFGTLGTPRIVNPSQVMSFASSCTVPLASMLVTIDSRPRWSPVASRPALAPRMVRAGFWTLTVSV